MSTTTEVAVVGAEKRPSVFFSQIMGYLRTCSKLVGADVFVRNYRPNILTGFVVFLITMYFSFTISTILKLFSEDWKILLEATCMASSVVQGCTKLFCAITSIKIINDSLEILTNIYDKYETQGPEYVSILNTNCFKIQKIIKIILIAYFIPASCMVALPFVMLPLTGRRYMIMHFRIPGLDVNTRMGYFITTGAHSACMFAGTFGLFAGDLLMVIYLMNSFTFVDILKLKIQRLNILLDSEEGRRNDNVNEFLNDIVRWHQLYSSFIAACNKTFYAMVTVIVTTSGGSIVLTLFIILAGDWPGAYPYLVVGFYSLYIYCILGTKLEYCNDDFRSEIYNINWYNLSPSQRKIVRFMLMKSQSPEVILVAGVLPLSVNTALQITKTIYSIFMMMVQFLEA